jgi:hypothetical protein
MQSIAIHTFSTLIFRLRSDTNLFSATLIVGGIWVAIVLDIAINVGIHGASRFYGLWDLSSLLLSLSDVETEPILKGAG